MTSINDLPQLPEIPSGAFNALEALSNLSKSDLMDHLDLTISILLAYEGADISAETNAISELLLRTRQKIEAHERSQQIAPEE